MQVNLTLFIATLVVSGGCLETAVNVPSSELPQDLDVVAIPFEIVGYNTPVATGGHANPNGGPVTVRENATLLVMEAKWTCMTATCQLELFLFDPGGSAGDHGTGNRGGRHDVRRPGPGEWNAQVRPEAAEHAKGQIRVTVFYGPVPESYTAFE